MRNIKRAYFTYPVADGLLEAATIFAAAARAEGLELVVNNSQFQGIPGDPAFRDSAAGAAVSGSTPNTLTSGFSALIALPTPAMSPPPPMPQITACVSGSSSRISRPIDPWPAMKL